MHENITIFFMFFLENKKMTSPEPKGVGGNDI
jgi:hypothetical protein